MEKNIMLAFVSPVNQRSLAEPVCYPDILGEAYQAIQTNESAIVYMQRKLGNQPLDRIFLIVSQEVKVGEVPAENEYGKLSHVEFLKKRIVKVYPELEDKFAEWTYSDDLADLDSCISSIADIAEEIKRYAKMNPGAKIVLHADMTGGFRHTSMMMLSIMQLLKYSGILIGEVLYSDPRTKKVYLATSIHRMFDLISGADEFVNFGSVKSIQKYFGSLPKEKKSEELNELLEAMENFSDAIKVCRTAKIKSVLAELNGKILKFKKMEQEKKSMPERVFSKIIETIQLEYGKMIGEKNVSELDIIEWCVKRELLQQAMTLYTEWLPIYFVRKRICYPIDTEIEPSCSKGVDERKSSTWQQYFFVRYTKKYGEHIREQINNLYHQKKIGTKFPNRWQDVIRCLEKYDELRNNRNEINHAKESDSLIETNKLKKKILTSLENIRALH